MSTTTRLLSAATAAVFVVGFAVATATPGPLLTADDLAYLSLARALAGEGASPVPPQPPYGVLYPVLLAPGWLVGLGESAMLTWARAVNALAGALLVPVLFATLRRTFADVNERAALVAAMAAALLPAGLLTASIVWTERLLALLVAVAVLALVRAVQDPSPAAGLAAAGAAVAMTAAHPRLGVAAVIVIVFAVVALRDLGLRVGAAVVLTGGGGLLFVEWAREALAEAAFGAPGTYDAADLASRRGLDELVPMLQHGLGALTYVVLATTGIAVFGAVVLARRGPVGWPVLAIGVGVLVVAAWFLTGIPRADKWLHGRYIEVLSPVLVAVGLTQLHRLRGRLAVGLVVLLPVVAGIVAAWNGPGDTWASARSPVMMLGVEVSGAPYGGGIFEPGAAASVAIVVGGLAWIAARVRPGWAAVVVVAASMWGAHSGTETLDQLFLITPSGAVDELLPDDEAIDELFVDTARVSPNLTGALAWEVGFDRSVLAVGPQTSHVLIPVDAEAPAGAELVVEFAGGNLWRVSPG